MIEQVEYWGYAKVNKQACLIIFLPGMPKCSEVGPEEYMLEENEERSMIEPKVGERGEVYD